MLAINRHGETIIDTLSSTRLKFGDVLLVQGKRRLIEPLVVDNKLLLLEEVSASSMRTEKRHWALAAFGLFLFLSLSRYFLPFEVPLVIAVLISVLLLLATKTVRYAELYTLIDFRLLVLIACMVSFGTAMEKTGTDVYLAALIQNNLGTLRLNRAADRILSADRRADAGRCRIKPPRSSCCRWR